jgi:hypothetical protein
MMATPERPTRSVMTDGVPHPCAGCGRPIRWALARCFNCASPSRWKPVRVSVRHSRVQQALEYIEGGGTGFGQLNELSTEELVELVEMLRQAGGRSESR